MVEMEMGIDDNGNVARREAEWAKRIRHGMTVWSESLVDNGVTAADSGIDEEQAVGMADQVRKHFALTGIGRSGGTRTVAR